MKVYKLLTAACLALLSFNIYAATVDGVITSGEYQWNTDGVEGSDKWLSFPNTEAFQEYDDSDGGDRWDFNYLGTNVADGNYQFGVRGGEILSGQVNSGDYLLGDIAIGVNTSTDPRLDSSGFDYAIRLLSVNDVTNEAEFALLANGTWEIADIYDGTLVSETYRMGSDAQTLTTFTGSWTLNDGTDNVLEGEFDMSFLSILSPTGGSLSTYLTMNCVNDEVLVHADLTAVPVPAAIWLFGPALAGFMGLRRRKTV